MEELASLFGFGEGAWGPALMAGTLVTIQIAFTSYLVGMGIGLIGAVAKLRGPAPARIAANGYTTIIRGLPEILLILLIYYGGTSAVDDLVYLIAGDSIRIEIDPFAAAVAALGIICGAYSTEIFRGSIQAVPVSQIEAAQALSLPRLITFFRVVFPQAMRHALPALGNLWLIVLKDSALISVVGLRDLVGVAASGAARTRMPFTFYSYVALTFLVLSIVSMIAFHYAERYYARGQQVR